ncbi:DUF6318 family protein, partial [Sinomonas sp. G460-2]|uniref:DUF6318 family protein n=1 Tax=Sinomonas sp. G460-2 TaxID=3393464 RepID=UPI0039F14C20
MAWGTSMALYRSVRLAFRLAFRLALRFAFRLVFRLAFRRASRSAGLAAVVVFGLGLAACGSGPGDAVPSGTSSSGPSVLSGSSSAPPTPDSRPTPASSRGPARNLPKPVLPEAAKQNTKEGFAAFTQYWLNTVTYAFETGDAKPLTDTSDKSCKVCERFVQDSETLHGRSGWSIGPTWTVQDFSSDMRTDPYQRVLGRFLGIESPSTE